MTPQHRRAGRGELRGIPAGARQDRTELRESYRGDAESAREGHDADRADRQSRNINATPADIAEELAALSRQYGQPIDRIRKAFGNNVVSLMDGIVRNKTLEFLIDNAEVVETVPGGSAEGRTL
jgi:FKBP-type peptidyl-prolyl cis-trans isomerase (trigger factor)